MPPFFAKHLTNIPVKLGEDAKLSCKIDGFPPPEVTWFKGGHPIDIIGETLEECIGCKYNVTHKEKDVELVVQGIVDADLGNYSCKVKS